jgi:molecular chaperone DnaK (HSP70)
MINLLRTSTVTIAISALLSGCSGSQPDRDNSPPQTRQTDEGKVSILKKPIGIGTAGDAFTVLVPAGQRLPHTFSDTFTNKTDGGSKALVVISQKDSSGTETIANLIVPIPPDPDDTLQITVTLKISAYKQMTIKTTVAEEHSVKEFGPFPVE